MLDAVRHWALGFATEKEFNKFFIPLFENRDLGKLKNEFYNILSKANPPEPELLIVDVEINQSPFEFFFQISYNKAMPEKIFKKFISFIPIERAPFFISRFTKNIDIFDLIKVITFFPDVNVTYLYYCKLMLYEKTFMSAFLHVIKNYDFLPSDLKLLINNYFRKALINGICKDSLCEMVYTAFEYSPERVDKYSEALNMFFSALTDDTSILMKYCSLKNIDNLFEHCKNRNDLPPSFLRFLIFTSATYVFTDEQFWAFTVSSPAPIFSYINHLDDLHNESMWIQILSNIFEKIPAGSIDLQNNIFLAFLLSVLQRPDLMSIFIQHKLHKEFPQILKQYRGKLSKSQPLIALLVIYLSFVRICEKAAKHALFLESMLQEESDQADEVFENSLLWVFSPSQTFPIDGVIKLEHEQSMSLFPYPSFSFIKHISPMILNYLIQIKNKEIQTRRLAKILRLINNDNMILFQKITSTNILQDLLTDFLNDDQKADPVMKANKQLYYNFIVKALSISCDFSIFSPLFKSLCTDIDKSIDFLTILAKDTSLVDDFLHIDNEFPLVASMMNGTITMWIRKHAANGIIFTITEGNTKIEVWHEFNDFYLSINEKIVNRILNTVSIENWQFISFSLSQKLGIFSVNLDSFSFPISIGPKPSITIGSSYGIFDLQSLKIQRPILDSRQILRLFALGPNFKEFIITDFMSFQDQQPLFASYQTFISKLYINWVDSFNEQPLDSYAPSNVELTISPPFQTMSSTRKSSSNILLIKDTSSIFKQRISISSFLNSFDTMGGLNFLVHLWAEVILKNRHLLQKMFELVDILLNRFPLVHHYFLRHSIYCLIGHLMQQVSYDTFHLGFSREHDRITNTNIIQYWVLGPILNNCEFPDSVKVLIDIARIPQNQILLEKSKAFVTIVQHISQGVEHSPEFMKLLCNLALTITNSETCIENGTFLFNTLMIKHLRFSKQCVQSQVPTITLVKLLNSMLETFIGLNTKLNLELMMPAVIHESGYQEELIDLLITFLNESQYYIFTVFLTSLPYSQAIAQRLYKDSERRISERSESPDLHFIIFPLVYFSTHREMRVYLYDLCTAATLLLHSYSNFPIFVYEQILQMICSLESLEAQNEDEQILSRSDSTENILPLASNNTSLSITSQSPFSTFVTTFLAYALQLHDYSNVKTFFISILAINTIAIYRKAAISLYFMGKTFDLLENIITYPFKELEDLLKFCLSYGRCIFRQIQMIPGDKTDLLSSILCNYFRSILRFVENCDSSDLINLAIETLIDFSTLNSICPMIIQNLNELNDYPKISKNRKFDSTIDRLQNPTGYPPIKIQPQKFEKNLEEQMQKFKERVKKDNACLLTIWCNAVHYQTSAAGEIILVDKNIETIIESWHSIFDSLLFPSSRIYENCPIKYKISDVTTRFERRRILMPINPSSNPEYLSFYDIKYNSPIPHVRLTLEEVLKNTSITLINNNDSKFKGNEVFFLASYNNVKFCGDVVRLTGISLLQGLLVVLDEQLKFYQAKYEDILTFNFSNIRNIKLTDYMHQPRGISIEDDSDNVYLFAFEAQSIRDLFIEICESIKIPIQKEIDEVELNSLVSQWVSGQISNFKYLLKLNFISGRTWADFTQYPIFPWTLFDFESKSIDLYDPKYYRKLDYPLFAQSNEQRMACETYYESIKEVNNNPHHYPNYISNVGSTLYFLVRLEPFTNAEFDFQGGHLDAADRTFQSFKITSSLMTTPGSKSALELVPEFYFIPEMLENKNNIVFNTSPINKKDISTVDLPPWSRSPIEFVKIMRDALESDIVSSSLNEWIDLIWGCRRQGKQGYERFNIIQDIVFDFNPEEYMNDYLLMEAMIDQMHNCGQAPKQLFTSLHPKRKIFSSMKEITLQYVCEKSQEDDFLKVSNSSTIYIRNNSICISRGHGKPITFQFANDIQPIAIDSYGHNLVTGHKLPLINHWTYSNKGLKYISTLRGHLSEIKCVLIQPVTAIILSGHVDGYISLFSTTPPQFIREIHCNSDSPIIMIKVVQSTSNFITFQRNNNMTIITLWTINGTMISVIKIPEEIIDCIISNFDEGTRRNIIIMLTSNDELIILRSETLEEKCRIHMDTTGHTSLSFYKFLLLVSKQDKSRTVFNLSIDGE